jgi:hypothetical protein
MVSMVPASRSIITDIEVGPKGDPFQALVPSHSKNTFSFEFKRASRGESSSTNDWGTANVQSRCIGC